MIHALLLPLLCLGLTDMVLETIYPTSFFFIFFFFFWVHVYLGLLFCISSVVLVVVVVVVVSVHNKPSPSLYSEQLSTTLICQARLTYLTKTCSSPTWSGSKEKLRSAAKFGKKKRGKKPCPYSPPIKEGDDEDSLVDTKEDDPIMALLDDNVSP